MEEAQGYHIGRDSALEKLLGWFEETSLIAFASSPLDQGVWLELSWVVFAVERGTNSRVGIVGACGFGR